MASSSFIDQRLIIEKIHPRRIVLEETCEERSLSYGDWYEDDEGNVHKYLNKSFGSRRTYKTWREVKETDIPLTNDEPKLSFSVEECRSLQMYGMSDSAVTRRIREFLKGSQTYKKEED